MERENRTIIIGDIHGTILEFQELLQKVNYSKNDKLILLGDLLDRGNDSPGCVKLARELGAISVLGNHDLKFLRWYKSNRKVYEPQDFYKDFSDEDIDYLHKMPLYYQLDENSIAVHGGLRPFTKLEDQKIEDCCYLRYVDENFNQVSIRNILKNGTSGVSFWTKYWTENINVVYGHCVHSMEHPRIDKNEAGGICYGLDTGSVFGGFLTALIWETKEIVQVKAKKVYYESKYAELDI